MSCTSHFILLVELIVDLNIFNPFAFLPSFCFWFVFHFIFVFFFSLDVRNPKRWVRLFCQPFSHWVVEPKTTTDDKCKIPRTLFYCKLVERIFVGNMMKLILKEKKKHCKALSDSIEYPWIYFWSIHFFLIVKLFIYALININIIYTRAVVLITVYITTSQLLWSPAFIRCLLIWETFKEFWTAFFI